MSSVIPVSTIPTTINVLVIGYGHAGGAVIRGLTAAQYKNRITVSVLVRSASLKSDDKKKKATLDQLTSLGVHLVEGDIDSDEPTLTAALKGMDTVISTVSVGYLRQQINLIKAAVAAGVRHFFPSEYGFDLEKLGRGSIVKFFDDKLDVRDAAIKSGINYTFINSGAFGEFALSPFFGVNINEGTVLAPGSVDNKTTIVGLADLGALVAIAVLSPQARNKQINLAGDTVTYKQIAAAIESVTKKSVKLTVQSVDELKAKIAADPNSLNTIIAQFALLYAQQHAVYWEIADSWNAIHVPEYKTATLIDIVRDVVAKQRLASA